MTKVNDNLFVERLKSVLVDRLKIVGIRAKVNSTPVPTTKMHRIKILAPSFKPLKFYERQELVWRIAERVLYPDEQLKIASISTMTPIEAKEI